VTDAQLTILADWDHMDWGAGGWILMAIGMALFWGLLIFGAVWLVRTLNAPAPHAGAPAQPSALEILDRGLAEGTVSVEEYEQRRRLLTGSSNDG
jgi:putative membrane protein